MKVVTSFVLILLLFMGLPGLSAAQPMTLVTLGDSLTAGDGSVTLSATPAEGSRFAGWSGACNDSGNCVLNLSRAVDVVATFNADSQPPPPTSHCDAGDDVQLPETHVASGTIFECEANRISTSAAGFVVAAGGRAVLTAHNIRLMPGFRVEANGQFLAQAVKQNASGLLQIQDFHYLGAFRLPDAGERPNTFAYGGNAMTFNPEGDPENSDDFPGSLFISGHDRLAYGELPNGGQIAEVSIPEPVVSEHLEALNTASFLQNFHNVFAGWFTQLEEVPRMAMQYLNKAPTGAKIHAAWGAHFQSETRDSSHVWFNPELSSPDMQGPWFIDDQDPYRINGYMLEIPEQWADAHANGQYLGTGRFRDGGWSGMGPNLFSYLPWVDEQGTPATPDSALPATALLAYDSSLDNEDITSHALQGYQHPDEWEGAAWITTRSGKTALLFAGTKGIGNKFWYGWVNPAGAELPCVETELVDEMTVCYQADGRACPAEDLDGCSNHDDSRGWWSSEFSAWLLLYDPADLEKVAAGQLAPWEPQPYAHLAFDEHLFFNPSGVEEDLLGSGQQRRYRIGEVAYDRAHDLLYVLELFADDAKPVVHVWKLD